MSDQYADVLRAQIALAKQRGQAKRAEADVEERRADVLQEALEIYLANRRAVDARREFSQSAPAPDKRKNRPSKFGPILAEIQARGRVGMSIEEMFTWAHKNNHPIKRTSLRSRVWTHKTDGKLEEFDGKYRVPGGESGWISPTDPDTVFN